MLSFNNSVKRTLDEIKCTYTISGHRLLVKLNCINQSIKKDGFYALILEFCMMLYVSNSSVLISLRKPRKCIYHKRQNRLYYTELKRILWQDWQVALPKLCNWHELKDIKISMNIIHIGKKRRIKKIQFDTFCRWLSRLLAKRLFP